MTIGRINMHQWPLLRTETPTKTGMQEVLFRMLVKLHWILIFQKSFYYPMGNKERDGLVAAMLLPHE